MLSIEKVDTEDKDQARRFVQFYYDLYKDCPQFVPPPFGDAYLPLNRKKHPFFEHSFADFFVAFRDGKVVGRICVADNRPFNEYHKTRKAHFFQFDAVDDLEVARLLFDTAFEWSRARGLDTMIGPKGLSPFDGYGIQVEGFEHRQMMTMMNYNFDYYPKLVEALGFEKEVDFVSCYLPSEAFRVPERVQRIAERAAQRGKLQGQELQEQGRAAQVGLAYRGGLQQDLHPQLGILPVHQGRYPVRRRQRHHVRGSSAHQGHHPRRGHRRLPVLPSRMCPPPCSAPRVTCSLSASWTSFSKPCALGSSPATAWASCRNFRAPAEMPCCTMKWARPPLAFASLPSSFLWGGFGGFLRREPQFKHVEMTQVAETTRQMRADLKNLNGIEYKNHRVYRRADLASRAGTRQKNPRPLDGGFVVSLGVIRAA